MNKQELLGNISQFIDAAETRINNAVDNGSRISAASLAREIAGNFGLTAAQGVAIIGTYVGIRSDLKSSKGKGIGKKA